MPLLERDQLAPPSVLRNTPSPHVPANTNHGSAGDAATEHTLPPSNCADVHESTPAAAGAAGTTVTSATRAPSEMRNDLRRSCNGAMVPYTAAPRRRPILAGLSARAVMNRAGRE